MAGVRASEKGEEGRVGDEGKIGNSWSSQLLHRGCAPPVVFHFRHMIVFLALGQITQITNLHFTIIFRVIILLHFCVY